MAITVDQASVVLDGKPVLANFSLTLPDTGVVCLCGPSGCGKSTLLSLLAGLRRPQSGAVRGLEQRRVSMMFQEDRLLPWCSAADNVSLVQPKGRAAEALPWLELVELAEEGNQFPGALSGGMRRRVALARALAYEGDLLLLDEPTNGLDDDLAGRIMSRVKEHYAGRLMIVVTHNREFAAKHADLLIELAGPPLRIISG